VHEILWPIDSLPRFRWGAATNLGGVWVKGRKGNTLGKRGRDSRDPRTNTMYMHNHTPYTVGGNLQSSDDLI
jgi:hypothetical protein